MEKCSPFLKALYALFFLVFILGFSPLKAESIKPPLIATGYYYDGHLRRPLLLQTLDLGQNWQYPESIHEGPLPYDFLDGGVSKSSCFKDHCIATGNYYNTLANQAPLLLQSLDRGITWSFQAIKNTHFKAGWFNDATCKEKGCIAVGQYDSKKGVRPLLALSDAKGVWHYSASLGRKLPSGFKEGWFNAVSCKSRDCVAAGTYLDTNGQRHPLLMLSQNNNRNWREAKIKDFADNANSNSASYLYASTCERQYCVAVGEYGDSQQVIPLLLQSTPKKQQWAKPSLPLPHDFLSGWFNAVACKEAFCIAVGNYNNGDIIRPLLVFSADGGAHWQLKEDLDDAELGTHLEYGSYMSASCNDKGCVAGGYFSNYFNTYPLVTLSQDLGQTWLSPASARTSVPAAELGNGLFREVHCALDTCIAAGDYTIDDVYFPLLALSQDGGLNWNFPKEINSPEHLPANFINGHF